MVESNIRRGTVKIFQQAYVKVKFSEEQKIIERTILQRVLCSNKEFRSDEYEMLMLDGVRSPEILPPDKQFLETFKRLKIFTMNSCYVRNLSNFP